jgi:hypothetical protein
LYSWYHWKSIEGNTIQNKVIHLKKEDDGDWREIISVTLTVIQENKSKSGTKRRNAVERQHNKIVKKHHINIVIKNSEDGTAHKNKRQ